MDQVLIVVLPYNFRRGVADAAAPASDTIAVIDPAAGAADD